MHPHIYFAIAALAATPALPEALKHLAWTGEFRKLERQLAAAIDAGRGYGPEDQAYADLHLTFGRYDEAERLYEDMLRHVSSDRDLYRLMSCRHVAWQSLFLHRRRTALECFKRLVEDENAGSALRLESWLGLSLISFQMGQLRTAWDCSERLTALSLANEQSRWSQLAAALRRDLITQLRMRASDGLIDHILWRSLVKDEQFPPDNLVPTKTHELTGALEHFNTFQLHLRALVDGRQDYSDQFEGYIRWVSGLGMPEYHRVIHVDVALAALAGGDLAVTQRMLHSFGIVEATLPRGGHWMLDHLYCQVSVLRWQGRCVPGDNLYRRYCLLAIQRAREDAMNVDSLLPLHALREANPPGDDMSVRLVGKYRRAYRFLIKNLDRSNLSVKEIAAHVGVTERSLQLVMRKSLGMSPGQLIRRLRMERIRNDLLEVRSGKGIFAIAEKWGVRHRSSLAIAYRREYNESPSETMLRLEP